MSKIDSIFEWIHMMMNLDATWNDLPTPVYFLAEKCLKLMDSDQYIENDQQAWNIIIEAISTLVSPSAAVIVPHFFVSVTNRDLAYVSSFIIYLAYFNSQRAFLNPEKLQCLTDKVKILMNSILMDVSAVLIGALSYAEFSHNFLLEIDKNMYPMAYLSIPPPSASGNNDYNKNAYEINENLANINLNGGEISPCHQHFPDLKSSLQYPMYQSNYIDSAKCEQNVQHKRNCYMYSQQNQNTDIRRSENEYLKFQLSNTLDKLSSLRIEYAEKIRSLNESNQKNKEEYIQYCSKQSNNNQGTLEKTIQDQFEELKHQFATHSIISSNKIDELQETLTKTKDQIRLFPPLMRLKEKLVTFFTNNGMDEEKLNDQKHLLVKFDKIQPFVNNGIFKQDTDGEPILKCENTENINDLMFFGFSWRDLILIYRNVKDVLLCIEPQDAKQEGIQGSEYTSIKNLTADELLVLCNIKNNTMCRVLKKNEKIKKITNCALKCAADQINSLEAKYIKMKMLYKSTRNTINTIKSTLKSKSNMLNSSMNNITDVSCCPETPVKIRNVMSTNDSQTIDCDTNLTCSYNEFEKDDDTELDDIHESIRCNFNLSEIVDKIITDSLVKDVVGSSSSESDEKDFFTKLICTSSDSRGIEIPGTPRSEFIKTIHSLR